MTVLVVLWLIALTGFVAAVSVKLYDDNQRLETRLFMVEHELDAICDRGMSGRN